MADSGIRQSPIDIIPGSSVPDQSLPELFLSYSPTPIKLINNGFTWVLDLDSQDSKSTISGGPLLDEYRVAQVHAHWGDKGGRGSEHWLDGKIFDAEIHIVHYNSKVVK